jgi:hypothetical protein
MHLEHAAPGNARPCHAAASAAALQVNSEHMHLEHAALHKHMDLFLCKTRFCHSLVQRYIKSKGLSAAVWYMGHSSIDPTVPPAEPGSWLGGGGRRSGPRMRPVARLRQLLSRPSEGLAAAAPQAAAGRQLQMAGRQVAADRIGVQQQSQHISSDWHLFRGQAMDYGTFLHVKGGLERAGGPPLPGI